MLLLDKAAWDETVHKTRAVIYAKKYPNPPLGILARLIIVLCSLVAIFLVCGACRVLVG